MKNLRILFILILSVSSFNACFSDEVDAEHEELTIADFVIKRRISPFEMPAFSVTYGKYDYKVVEQATGNKKFKKGGKISNFEIDLEKPMYKKYISYGLTFGVNFGTSPFTAAIVETALYAKFKMPLHLGNAGDVALFVTGGLGVSVFNGFSGTPEEYFSAAAPDLADLVELTKGIEFRRGLVRVLRYGVDYYPIKWLGVSLGLQTRIYDYAQSQFAGGKKAESQRRYMFYDSFSYTVKNSFIFSVRTTF